MKMVVPEQIIIKFELYNRKVLKYYKDSEKQGGLGVVAHERHETKVLQ